MSAELRITIAPEQLDEGSAEERAAFGLFTVEVGTVSLTEGMDAYISAPRRGPLVSGYHAAEWFAWNWWRLRWEPRASAEGWSSAHSMTTIGEGYVWPRITITSDGVRTMLQSEPSVRPDARPFRYFGVPTPFLVPSEAFETAVDAFVPIVLARLSEHGVRRTNLATLWSELLDERRDPKLAAFRRREALLGLEPGDAPDELLADLSLASETFGDDAIDELAAHRGHARRGDDTPISADVLMELGRDLGAPSRPGDAVRLQDAASIPKGPEVPAWKVGVAAAHALRRQEGFGEAPITNEQLADMAGTTSNILADARAAGPGFSFLLETDASNARIVLRGTKFETSRRFDLARLIGDRILAGTAPLRPATRALTYRQKMQRAFAGEFLCPFSALEERLADDYTDDAQEEAAKHFNVSTRTVETLLMNHHRVPRMDPDWEGDLHAA